MSILAPKTPIMLDKERNLIYDFRAFRLIEQVSGISIFSGGIKPENLASLPIFLVVLWAGLTREDNELTLDHVEQHIPLDEDSVDVLLRSVWGAISKALTPVKKEDSANP